MQKKCCVPECKDISFKNSYCAAHYQQFCQTDTHLSHAAPFKYPTGFDDAAAKFAKAFSREDLKQFANKFNVFDENGNGFIDFMELKRAQEKMGSPKTHKELTELIQNMATDPKQGISFVDFCMVQAKLKGLDPTQFGFTGSTFLPLVAAFVQQCNDFSVGGIKSHLEQKAATERAHIERDQKITEARKARVDGKAQARRAREEEERSRKAAEQAQLERRTAFKAKQNSMWAGGEKKA